MIFGPYRGIVDLVKDGDTVYVKLDLGFDITVYARVRVYGINAPETSTEAGVIARTYARSLLPVGAVVRVTSHGWDKYGGRIDGDILIESPVTASMGLERDFASLMVLSNNAAIRLYH